MSNLIKDSLYVPINDKKKIKVISHPIVPANAPSSQSEGKLSEEERKQKKSLEQFEKLKQKMINDAEEHAESLIKKAMDQALAVKEQAEQEISAWWEEKRTLDEEHIKKAEADGFELGRQEGLESATNEIKEQYAAYVEEGRNLVEQAHINKQRIIQEAEPFLLELSCEIAHKIIRQQLTISPEWMIALIKEVLTRKRGKGLITLCVSPAYYSYVQEFSEELALVLDSQAELQILPDGNVKDHGCVIRSSNGSIDATIDTQLTEVKSALYQIALQNEDVGHDD